MRIREILNDIREKDLQEGNYAPYYNKVSRTYSIIDKRTGRVVRHTGLTTLEAAEEMAKGFKHHVMTGKSKISEENEKCVDKECMKPVAGRCTECGAQVCKYHGQEDKETHELRCPNHWKALGEDVGTSGLPGGGENAGGGLGPLKLPKIVSPAKTRPTPKSNNKGKQALMQTNESVIDNIKRKFKDRANYIRQGLTPCKDCDAYGQKTVGSVHKHGNPNYASYQKILQHDKPCPNCSGTGWAFKRLKEDLADTDAAVTEPDSGIVKGQEKVEFANKPPAVKGALKNTPEPDDKKDIANIKDYLRKRNDRLQKLNVLRGIGGVDN